MTWRWVTKIPLQGRTYFSTTGKTGLQCPSAAKLSCLWSCSSPRQPMSGVSQRRKASHIILPWGTSGGHYSLQGSPPGQPPHRRACVTVWALPLPSTLPASSFYRCRPLTNALHFKLFLLCFRRSQPRIDSPGFLSLHFSRLNLQHSAHITPPPRSFLQFN